MVIEEFFNAIFSFITQLGSTILVGPINMVTTLFPDLKEVIQHVTTWFTQIVTYIPLVLNLLMIPRSAVVFFFDYIVIKYSIYLVIRIVKLVITVYNKLKI